jgi:hypothetical protein
VKGQISEGITGDLAGIFIVRNMIGKEGFDGSMEPV